MPASGDRAKAGSATRRARLIDGRLRSETTDYHQAHYRRHSRAEGVVSCPVWGIRVGRFYGGVSLLLRIDSGSAAQLGRHRGGAAADATERASIRGAAAGAGGGAGTAGRADGAGTE